MMDKLITEPGQHDKQVEAYYKLVTTHIGKEIRVPIPLRGEPIPTQEDYENSVLIWTKVQEILQMMGIPHLSSAHNLSIRVQK